MPASEPLSGDELAAAIWLKRAAVENWARITGQDAGMTFISARMALLDAIRSDGTLSVAPPEWMTSPKPGVDAWVSLPGGAVLALMPGDGDSHGRRYTAANALACRRGHGGRRRRQGGQLPSRAAQLDDAAVAALRRLEPSVLAAAVAVTDHAAQRLIGRLDGRQPPAGLDEAKARITAMIADGGRVLSPAPHWTRASGRDIPVIVTGAGEAQVAFPLVPDASGQGRAAAVSTCLPRAWADADLLSRRGAELAAAVTIPRRLAAGPEAQAVLERIESTGMPYCDGSGYGIACRGLDVRLRPAERGWTARQLRRWTPEEQ